MELYQRVKFISKELAGSETKMATLLGIQQRTFNGYLSQDRQDNLLGLLPRILQEYPQISREWLYFGEGEMLKTGGPQSVVPSLQAATVREQAAAMEREIATLRELMASKDKIISVQEQTMASKDKIISLQERLLANAVQAPGAERDAASVAATDEMSPMTSRAGGARNAVHGSPDANR